MNTRMRATAVALPIEIGDLDANLARIREVLDAMEADGPHLVVLPELATSGYVFRDAAEARTLAMRSDDPRLTSLVSAVPAGGVAVVGFCETDGDLLFNSALIVGRDGVLGCYRKAHLWDAENDVFTPGPEAGAVFDTPVGRLGVAICYDSEFPELPRRLALAGAEVLALPVNWPKVTRPDGEHPPETIQAMASARSSRLATVIADRHGIERGVEWTGGTAIISPDGWICAEPGDGVVATAVLELSDSKSLGAHTDLFIDRRPELYHGLTEKREIHA
jgi:predicted amidohydrolase